MASFNPAIPVVDFTPFLADSPPNPELRTKTANALNKASSDLGFVYITNHGISPSLLDEAFAWTKKLFDLSHEDKMKAPHPPGGIPHRGYSHPGLEKVYAREDLEKDGKEETPEEKEERLRKVEDFKVFPYPFATR